MVCENVIKKGVMSIFFLVCVLSFSSFVLGQEQALNITFAENVFQNVSFAENFDGVENVQYCNIEGTVNVTNPGAENVFDIYLRMTNTNFLSTNFSWDSTTKFGNQTTGTPGSPIVLHIPLLRPSNYSTFRYNISCASSNPPVDMSTIYANSDHGHELKVLAGQNWTVTQTAFNNLSIVANVTNLVVRLRAQNVSWNGSLYNFSLETLNALGDYSNVTGNGTSTTNWTWTPNGGTLAHNTSANISFIMRAPYSVPFTSTYLALIDDISYQANYLMSNLSLDEVNASGEVTSDFEKRIYQPSDNLNDRNVTWQINPEISTPANFTMTINAVTLWVSQNLDPNNKTNGTHWGLLEQNFTGPYTINISSGWGNTTTYWRFNYTDGSSSAYPPPIVWIQPKWIITNSDGQILNFTSTVSGSDLYLKYIYVINGYWLEIQKNVTTIDEDSFYVFTFVQNIGNGWTPQNELVTVYDFVPNGFTPRNFSDNSSINLSVGSAGTDFYGTSYRWNIPWKDGKNSSLGPSNGPSPTSYANYSWNVSYFVDGTGPYEATQLYIVGLDPLKVDGASASPIISIIAGLQTYTNEIMYIAIVVFLIVINLANLVITNRIHTKLDSIPPPSSVPRPGVPRHGYQTQQQVRRRE